MDRCSGSEAAAAATEFMTYRQVTLEVFARCQHTSRCNLEKSSNLHGCRNE
jgi:hypothetical protein